MKVYGPPVKPEEYAPMTVDGIFIKKYHVRKGMIVPQHSHQHSHVTFFTGRVRVWKGEDNTYTEHLGGMIFIEALVKHNFLAMEDLDIYCIHNADHALIAAENQLEFV